MIGQSLAKKDAEVVSEQVEMEDAVEDNIHDYYKNDKGISISSPKVRRPIHRLLVDVRLVKVLMSTHSLTCAASP